MIFLKNKNNVLNITLYVYKHIYLFIFITMIQNLIIYYQRIQPKKKN